MRARFCISLLVIGVCSLACSSSSKATQTNPQSTGTESGRIYNLSALSDDESYGYLDANDNCAMPS